jgi:FMN-dependent dehydrogenase
MAASTSWRRVEVTMRENRRAFAEVMFRPRAAVFHQERYLRTTVLGHEIAMPVIVSSVFLSIGHPDGEAGVARGAGAAGTILFVSGVTNTLIAGDGRCERPCLLPALSGSCSSRTRRQRRGRATAFGPTGRPCPRP